ncbi:MAG: chemotaxis protein CheW, partial [Rubripirellula sp.]|nr:chemotaxis protein CheW [Rubripirellula sp.]
PLLPLSTLLEQSAGNPQPVDSDSDFASKAVKAIVINTNDSRTAIAVHEIIDVAEQQGPLRLSNEPEGLVRGAAVIDGKVRDVLDVESVLHRCGIHLNSPIGATT